MIRSFYILFTFCVLVISTSLSAQTIAVRSGAHDGFSRLVLLAPREANWSITEKRRGATLRINGFNGRFDTSSVFDLIDRRYIADVQSSQGELQLSFSCDCKAETFLYRDRYIVIDVGTGRTASTDFSDADFPWLQSDTELRLPGIANRIVGAFGRSLITSPLAAQQSSGQVPTSEALTSNFVTPEVFSQSFPVLDDEIAEVPLEQLRRAQHNLSERVAVAATRGVLQSNHNELIGPFVSETRSQIDATIFDSSEPETPSGESVFFGSPSNLRISSSLDLPENTLSQLATLPNFANQCEKGRHLEIGSWGADSSPISHLSSLKAQLFDEQNRLNRDVAQELGQAYLYYGFGAEARQVLTISGQPDAQQEILLAIADVLEFGYSPAADRLSNNLECANSLALWAIVAQRSLDSSTFIDSNAALLALTELPVNLRKVIAPILSRRLVEAGDISGAEVALRSLERSPEELPSEASLARAELQFSTGQIDGAQQTLTRIVESNAQNSAEALIRLVNSHLETETPLDAELVTLVEAYAIELKNDPLGLKLNHAYVLALAQSGQFDAASHALQQLQQQNGGSVEADLFVSLTQIITRDAPDVVFLEHYFNSEQFRPNLFPQIDRLRVADRLLDLGFPAEAEVLLAQDINVLNTAQATELRAEIALELNRPQEAQAILSDFDSAQATLLRARIEEKGRNFDEAADLFERLGQESQSLQNAWLAGDFERVSEDNSSPFGNIAAVVATEANDPGGTEGMLRRMTRAVTESEQAREAIDSLLVATETEIGR